MTQPSLNSEALLRAKFNIFVRRFAWNEEQITDARPIRVFANYLICAGPDPDRNFNYKSNDEHTYKLYNLTTGVMEIMTRSYQNILMSALTADHNDRYLEEKFIKFLHEQNTTEFVTNDDPTIN